MRRSARGWQGRAHAPTDRRRTRGAELRLLGRRAVRSRSRRERRRGRDRVRRLAALASHTCAVCHTNGPGLITIRLEADHPELFTTGWSAHMQYHLRGVMEGETEGRAV